MWLIAFRTNPTARYYLIAAVFVLLIRVMPARANLPGYTLTDLGTLGGAQSSAYGINNSGQIVGSSEIGSGGSTLTVAGPLDGSLTLLPISMGPPPQPTVHSFIYQNGSMVDLNNSGDGESGATAINDRGQIVGSGFLPGNVSRQAFIYSAGTMTMLGTLGGIDSQASAINNYGQVAGTAFTNSNNGAEHAFIYSNGAMVDLGTLGGNSSFGNGINDNGEVVGEAYLSGSLGSHAFLYKNGTMNDLVVLGGPSNFSEAYAINNHEQIVGSSSTGATFNGGAIEHGFLDQNGVMQDLGTLGGLNSGAFAINNSGQAVGFANTADDSEHAALFENGEAIDLNDLISPGSGWTLQDAFAINDSGQIIGIMTDGAFRMETDTPGDAIWTESLPHAFLLTPEITTVPEPAPWPIILVASIGFGLRRGHTKSLST